jgi:peptide chain release factor subunit 1
MSTPNPAQELREDDPNTTNLPEGLMNRLLDFEAVSAPVISLYLDGRTKEHGQHTFLPYARRKLAEKARTFAPHSPERASFDEDVVRILRYLENGVSASTRGLAIFACSAANDFFQIGQFDVPFERDRLFVADRPHLFPLARLIDQYRRYAVVLADTNRAQIFVFVAGRRTEREEIEDVKTKRAQIGGWSQARYQRHQENYHLHHAKEVIDVLGRTVREEAIEYVILAGDEETVIPLLRSQMSRELEEKVIDVLSVGIDTPEHELLEQTMNVFRAHDSEEDAQKVELLLAEYRADNLAVAGVPETIAALSNGQVEDLLISTSPESLQFDRAEVEKVLRVYEPDEGSIPGLDQRTLADELVRRAHQLSSARVTFIDDPSLLDPVGGVGALLRYRISAESAAPYEEPWVSPASEALQKD